MSFPDNSTKSPIMVLYNGLLAKAKATGFNVVLQLGEWRGQTQNQTTPVITIIPIKIKVLKPISPGIDILQSDLIHYEIVFWALDWDTLDICISWFRQYTIEIFYNFCEYDDVQFNVRVLLQGNKVEQEQDQKGLVALQQFKTHTDREIYRPRYDTDVAIAEEFDGTFDGLTKGDVPN
jgi:hypothetical protein